MVKRALEYLDGLSQERGNDAALSLELASAYKRVGDVQGRPNYASLDDRAGALTSYRKALTIFERSAAATPLSAGSDIGHLLHRHSFDTQLYRRPERGI